MDWYKILILTIYCTHIQGRSISSNLDEEQTLSAYSSTSTSRGVFSFNSFQNPHKANAPNSENGYEAIDVTPLNIANSEESVLNSDTHSLVVMSTSKVSTSSNSLQTNDQREDTHLTTVGLKLRVTDAESTRSISENRDITGYYTSAAVTLDTQSTDHSTETNIGMVPYTSVSNDMHNLQEATGDTLTTDRSPLDVGNTENTLLNSDDKRLLAPSTDGFSTRINPSMTNEQSFGEDINVETARSEFTGTEPDSTKDISGLGDITHYVTSSSERVWTKSTDHLVDMTASSIKMMSYTSESNDNQEADVTTKSYTSQPNGCNIEKWGEYCNLTSNCVGASERLSGMCKEGCHSPYIGNSCQTRLPSLNESFLIVKPFPNGAIQLSFRYVDNNEPQSLLPDRYSITDTRNQTIEMIELEGRNTSISLMIRNLTSSQPYSFIVTPYSLYNNTWHRGIPTQQTAAVLPGCPISTWNDKCQSLCRCLNSTELCNRGNGSCTSGCANHYVGYSCNATIPAYDMTNLDIHIEVSHSSARVTVSAKPKPSKLRGGYEVVQLQTFILYYKMFDGRNSSSWENMSEFHLQHLRPGSQYFIYLTPMFVYENKTYLGDHVYNRSFHTEAIADYHRGVLAGIIIMIMLLLVLISGVLFIAYAFKRRLFIFKGNHDETYHLRAVAVLPKGTTEKLSSGDGGSDNQGLDADGDIHEIYANSQIEMSEPIDVHKMDQYVDTLLINGGSLLKSQYLKFSRTPLYPTCVASTDENKIKNRFTDIKPYDHSRVKLESVGSKNNSDYINASYITGCNGRDKHYIACQGPKACTVDDTWRLILQEQVTVIVMLTGLVEKGKVKCIQYWPEIGKKISYDGVKVEANETSEYSYYTETHLVATFKGESRQIKHLQFTGWPDHGVPSCTSEIMDFTRKIKRLAPHGPLLVHCSAGVGRTGTFIALDKLLDNLENQENVLDIVKTMWHLRQERHLMVQTESQFGFIYKAVVDAIKFGDTSVEFSQLLHLAEDQAIINKINEEFQKLRNSSSRHKDAPSKDGLSEDNINKNYDKNIIPCDSQRPYLSLPVDKRSNYINAVITSDYLRLEQTIITQHPLASTVTDMWRLIADHSIDRILMLNELHGENDIAYWPTNMGTLKSFGPLLVRLDHSSTSASGVIHRQFTLTNKLQSTDRIISHWQLTSWPENGETDDVGCQQVLELLEQARCLEKDEDDLKMIIHCRNGAERSGVIATLCYVLQKAMIDGRVDVFYAVNNLKRHRPEFVSDMKSYRLIYTLVMKYIQINSNFDNETKVEQPVILSEQRSFKQNDIYENVSHIENV